MLLLTLCTVHIDLSKSITVKCKRDQFFKSRSQQRLPSAAVCLSQAKQPDFMQITTSHCWCKTEAWGHSQIKNRRVLRIIAKIIFTNKINGYQLFIINHPVWVFLTLWVNFYKRAPKAFMIWDSGLFIKILRFIFGYLTFSNLGNLKETKTDSYNLWYFILKITTNQDFT